MIKKIPVFILAVLVLFSGAVASGADKKTYPRSQGYVSDYAGVMSRQAKEEVDGLLRKIEEKTTAEMAVVTVRTTAPETIEQYAVGLFKEWGIGKKGSDNGILLLLATEDRKVRIEVGYGLEGTVTDLQSKIIIEDLMIPAFRQGGYDLGISSGVVELAKLVRDHYGVEIDLNEKAAEVPPADNDAASGVAGLIILLVFLFILWKWWPFFLFASGGTGYWSGGSGGSFRGGGSFGGFGGGSSGGGGASGSW